MQFVHIDHTVCCKCDLPALQHGASLTLLKILAFITVMIMKFINAFKKLKIQDSDCT